MSDVYINLSVSGEQEAVAGIVKIQDALVSLQRSMDLMVGSMLNISTVRKRLDAQYKAFQTAVLAITGTILPDLDFGIKETGKAAIKWSDAWDTPKEKLKIFQGVLKGVTDVTSSLEIELDEGTKKLLEFAEGVGMMVAGIAAKDPVSIINGFVKVLKSLFAKDWGAEAKQALKGLSGVTEEMEKKLAKLAKELDSTKDAMNQLMAEFIKDAKLYSKSDFSGWANKVGSMMDQLKNEWGNSAKKLAGQVGESFEAMRKKADELGLHGSRSMLMMIDKARKLKEKGKEISEVFEYVQEKLAEGAGALKTYLSTFADTTTIQDEITAINEKLLQSNLSTEEAISLQEELLEKQGEMQLATSDIAANWDFMSAAALSTFNAMRESGMTFIESMTAMGPQLADLSEMAKAGGLEISGGLKEMTDMAAFMEQNDQLVTRIDATNQMMVALGDSAFMTQEDFTNFSTNAASQFDQLIAAGASEQQALMMLGPQLDNLIKYHESRGFAIGEETEALIKKAREEGALNNKTLTEGERQIQLQERMVDILARVAKKFGVDIPDALGSMQTQAVQSFNNLHSQTGKWNKGLSQVEDRMRKGLPDAVRGLDREYKERMTGHSIVTETDKWKYSLEEVEEKLGRDLIDTAGHLDKKYAPMMKNVSKAMNKDGEIAVWTPEETRKIQATPIARMNLSDEKHERRKGDIVFEHITIQSENGDEAVKDFMTAIKGNKYGVQNLIRKVAN